MSKHQVQRPVREERTLVPDGDHTEEQRFNSSLQAEAETVLSDPVFTRSPVLSRLLRYLVEETAAGRAELLKSFSVAVDGLGRSENFDPASDSSARVQMVRLRKALEMHYAQHAPIGEHCLYLHPGSYRVRMGKPAAAYPTVSHQLASGGSHTGETATVTGNDSAPHAHHSQNLLPTPRPAVTPHVAIGLLICIAAAIFTWLIWRNSVFSQVTPLSPVLEIMPVDSPNTAPHIQTARVISSTFANDLPRFKMSRVRVVYVGDRPTPTGGRETAYRLSIRLEDDPRNGQRLFLRLNDIQTNTALWSRELPLPDDPRAVRGALLPLIGEINGPFGIIATHGSTIYKNDGSGGYACLLKYFDFVETRAPDIEEKVAACFKKPVKEQNMEATILAARSLFAIERSGARLNFEAAARQGTDLARAAVAADPNDGSANFALARFSYLRNDCVSARYYTRRALETNPASPMITATLAAVAQVCDYPDAEALLDQAFLTQTPQFAKGRLLLILAALAQERPERIAEVKDSDLPEFRYNRINYYLAETLIAASKGRRGDAVRYWNLFSKAVLPGGHTPDEKLRGIVALPQTRQRLVNYLAAAGVFDIPARN